VLTIFRRRGVFVALGALLVPAFAVGSGGDQDRQLLRDPLRAILTLLEDRSPGERAGANLASTKQPKDSRRAAAGRAEGLSAKFLGREAPPQVGRPASRPDDLLALAAPLTSMAGLQGEPTLIPPADRVFDVAPVAAVQSSFQMTFQGAGKGGAGNAGAGLGGWLSAPRPGEHVNSSDLTGTSQIPAIPEPETWALMTLGMAFCGASMRRKSRTRLVEA